MADRENDIIAEAALTRADAQRKLKLLSDLRNLGEPLKDIGESLSPTDTGAVKSWSGDQLPDAGRNAAPGIDTIRALVAERFVLARTIREKTESLRKYGAEE